MGVKHLAETVDPSDLPDLPDQSDPSSAIDHCHRCSVPHVSGMPISEITVVHAVEFSETDAAGLVHFSNYFRYMEKAERELFSQANIPLVVDDGTLFFGWPRVNASCDFCAPLRFGDRVSIHLSIQEISRKAIRYRVRFTRNEPEDGTLVASGGMTALSAHLDRVKKTIATHPAGESILERLAAQLKPDKESGIS